MTYDIENKGISFMKKFLTTLIITLLTVISIFSANLQTDTLVLTCKLDGYTRVGFTENPVALTDIEIVQAEDRDVEGNSSFTLYASVISTNTDKLQMKVTLPPKMTALGTIDTIPLTYTGIEGNEKLVTLEKGTSIRRHSEAIEVNVGDSSNVMQGDYSATLVLEVTTEA